MKREPVLATTEASSLLETIPLVITLAPLLIERVGKAEDIVMQFKKEAGHYVYLGDIFQIIGFQLQLPHNLPRSHSLCCTEFL
ncbi:hypothetical protein Pfo_010000 [Paulownia fortunei]|nr:hypothetical protein Pfo_010000 [Paulownia fortunei]